MDVCFPVTIGHRARVIPINNLAQCWKTLATTSDNVLPLPSLNVQKQEVTDIHYLNVLEIMNKKLKQRIKEFNKIKFKNDNSKRIIVASLKPDVTKAIKYNK